MLKRISVLFALTGFAHIFSIAVLKFMAERVSPTQMGGIGEAESLIQFMIGIIGFGMQADAIRNIAISEDWKQKLEAAQRARITLGFILIVFGVLSFSEEIYLVFLMAPLLASSIDYAMYAKGYPIAGSTIAFVRVVVPLLFGLVAVFYLPQYVLIIYVCANGFIYFSSNIFMSFFLKVPLYYKPSLRSLWLYKKTLPLGVINLCFYFFGLGILLLAQLFFDERELVVTFLALKFYTVYKGAIRVIHQAFVTHMLDSRICLSIDQISILMSVAFVGSVIIFPQTFISLFFGKQFISDKTLFILIALSSIAFSLFQSSSTRVILENRDFDFMRIFIVSVALSVISLLVLVQVMRGIDSVAVSLLIGEIFFSCAVAFSFFDWNSVIKRMQYLLLSSLGLGLPLLSKFYFNEGLVNYLLSFAIMGIVIILLSYKTFALSGMEKQKVN